VIKQIVSFSGGKDSTAMLLRLIELNKKPDEVVFADTKLEFLEIYERVEKMKVLCEKEGITFFWLKTKQNFDDWFYGIPLRGESGKRGLIRGFPLTLFPCWWSRESKFKVLDSFCKNKIRILGIAKDEPKRIRKKEGYKYPLVEWGWSEKKCVDYLKKKGWFMEIDNRFRRTGCYLCPKQNKDSLRVLYQNYPKLWDKLKKYEKDSPQGFKPNFKLNEIEKKWANQTKLK